MAEGTLQVNEGTGKKLHTFQRTIGANTVEDEVMLLGENYLASYVTGPQANSTATANSHLIQIMAGASLKLRIRRIEMYQVAAATTAVLMDTQLWRLTTAGTGGTSQTPNALDPSDGAAGATVMNLPTAKGTEGTLLLRQFPYMMQTVAASAQLNQPILVWDFDQLRSKPLIIAAGTSNGIAVKNVTAVAAASVTFGIWFDEANF